MRFMIIVRSTPQFEAEPTPVPDENLFAEMAAYHEALAKAGVLLDGAGLRPSRHGWRIRYDAEGRTVVGGPHADSRELIAGYTLIEVRSREEAMAWSQRFPNPVGEGQPAEIEVRQLFEMDDFPRSDAMARMKDIGVGRQPD